jgi:hypothetical protein
MLVQRLLMVIPVTPIHGKRNRTDRCLDELHGWVSFPPSITTSANNDSSAKRSPHLHGRLQALEIESSLIQQIINLETRRNHEADELILL